MEPPPPARPASMRVLTRPPFLPASTSATAPPPTTLPQIPASSASSALSPPIAGVVVVGFLSISASTDTSPLINRLLDSNIFGSGGLDKNLVGSEKSDWFRNRRISYYHDSERGIVFLQFSSYISPLLLLSSPEFDRTDVGSVSALEEFETEDLRGMLFMFSVCHVIILLQEGLRFDTQILKKLRILRSSKQALNPFIKSQIPPKSHPKEVSSISPVSASPGLCSPVTLFVLQSNLSDLLSDTSNSVPAHSKKFLSSLEAQIRFLTKKLHISSRVTSNSSHTPLFSLDPSKAVTLLEGSTSQKADPLKLITDFLEDSFDLSKFESKCSSSANDEVQPIRDFINRQMDLLKGRGGGVTGNSSSGSIASAAVAAAVAAASASAGKPVSAADLPDFNTWHSLSVSILKTLIEKGDNNNGNNDVIEASISYLERSKGINVKFSISWCEKELPAAKQLYLQNLPSYYPTSVHEEHVKRALNTFCNTVKGVAVDSFAERLKEECKSIWQNGRQQCDTLSLTSQPCIHRRHDKQEGKTVITQHSSGYFFLHACACGRLRKLREDPFDFAGANSSFNVFAGCEDLLLSFEMEGTAGSVWRLTRLGRAWYYKPSEGLLQTGFCTRERYLSKWTVSIGTVIDASVCEKETSKDSGENRTENDGKKRENDSNDRGPQKFAAKKAFSEVVAGTAVTDSEFPALLRTNQLKPAGRPRKSGQNGNENGSEENGYNKAGKDGDSNPYLQIGSNIVPVITDFQGTKTNKSTQDFVVYIGFEHECPYGHRFLLSEEHINRLDSAYFVSEIDNSEKRRALSEKMHQNGVKVNRGIGFSLLNRRLPVFMNCPHCARSDKRGPQKIRFASMVSQLQRVFIVTPELPLLLATCPIVQFEESGMPASFSNRGQKWKFRPSSRVVLPPDSFLTLRLPFVYGFETEDGGTRPLKHSDNCPERTAWLVEGTALQIVSSGQVSQGEDVK